MEDGHVVGVLQQLLLQVLEHSQRVAEQDLKMRQDRIDRLSKNPFCGVLDN